MFPVSVEDSFFDCDVLTFVELAQAVVNDFTIGAEQKLELAINF